MTSTTSGPHVQENFLVLLGCKSNMHPLLRKLKRCRVAWYALLTLISLKIILHIIQLCQDAAAKERFLIETYVKQLHNVTITRDSLVSLSHTRGQDSKYILHNAAICGPNTEYFILVESEPDHMENRKVLRKLWFLLTQEHVFDKVEFRFLIHTNISSLSSEELEYLVYERGAFEDIVFLEPPTRFDDSASRNLKGFSDVISNLFVVWSLCQDTKFSVITNDNAYLNITNLVGMLEDRGQHWSVYGWFFGNEKLLYNSHQMAYISESLEAVDTAMYAISNDLLTTVLSLPYDRLVRVRHRKDLFSVFISLEARVVPEQGVLSGQEDENEAPITYCDLQTRAVISKARLRLEDLQGILEKAMMNQTGHCVAYKKKTTFWNYFKPRSQIEWTYDNRIVLENKALCRDRPQLIIMIHSHTNNQKNRLVTRETWASPAMKSTWLMGDYSLSTRLVFVLGSTRISSEQEAIKKEHAKFKDILQGSFEERYDNLAVKHTFGLAWIRTNCPHVTYILKADDDVIVNLPYLQRILEKAPIRRALIGSIRSSPWQRPMREADVTGENTKWVVSKERYPLNAYPTYLPGSSYLITADIVAELLDSAQYIPLLPLDDVFYTGFLPRTLPFGANHIYIQNYRNPINNAGNLHALACGLKANLWVDTYFWGDNGAPEVWKYLAENPNMNCDAALLKRERIHVVESDIGEHIYYIINIFLRVIIVVLFVLIVTYCVAFIRTIQKKPVLFFGSKVKQMEE